MSYGAKTVSAMTGIPRATLLAWERRYGVVDPRRSEGGHRIYSDADVELLRRLKQRIDSGFAISEAVRLERRRVEPDHDDEPLYMLLLEALSNYDRAAADRLSPRLSQLTFAQAIEQVHIPLLRETGALWAAGKLSIAQEHFISGWCREQLVMMLHGLGSGPAGGPTAVCALAPGEAHELGLMAVAIQLVLAGWRVTWLGADLPIRELCDYVRREGPRLVCLSTVFGSTEEQVEEWGRALRDAAPASTVVAIGGPGSSGLRIPGVVIADGVDNLLQAVRQRAS